LGKRSLPLPVLLNVNLPSEVTHPPLKATSQMEGWQGISVMLDGGPFDENPIPEALGTSLREAMDGSGLGRWKGLAGLYGARVLPDIGEGPVPAEVISSMLLPILLKDPRTFARAMGRLKEEAPCHPPVYVPGAANGTNLEALIYLGVEMVDDISSVLDGDRDIYYTMSTVISLTGPGKVLEPSEVCPCQACKGISSAGTKAERKALLAEHNRGTLVRRFKLARAMLHKGMLREHLLGTLSGKPEWLAAVRTIEGGGWPSLHAHTHPWKPVDRVFVTYRDDLSNPDLSLWARRIREEYTPLKRPILLMLPCSARKPYSLSRTHQRIQAALAGIKGLRRSVHMVVLTSPLGAVPMELETLYPAAHYDIPVTGEWFPEESALMRDLVSSIIRKGAYKGAICHLEGAPSVFPEALDSGELNGVPFVHVPETASSGGGLERLRAVVSDIVAHNDPGQGATQPDVEELLSLVRFSLDADLTDLPDLSSRYDRMGQVLLSGRKKLVMFKPQGPQPTLHCGKVLWEKGGTGNGRRVEIEDFSPTGTVFSQGVRSASGSIRPGDIVLVGTSERFKAVGRAMVPGHWMTSGRRGNAVRILDHI